MNKEDIRELAEENAIYEFNKLKRYMANLQMNMSGILQQIS